MAIGLIKVIRYFKKNDTSFEERWRYILKGGLAGGTLGYSSAFLLSSPNNTLNFRLFKNKKLVYYGITYEDRLIKRSNEHRRNGFMFDKVLKDKPKSRTDALILEKKKSEGIDFFTIFNIIYSHSKYIN